MKPVIETYNLGKSYKISHLRGYNTNLRERLAQIFTSNDSPEVFWALRGANLEVAPGEVLGILGKNGAGKSTLLKILGRITPPTEGRALVRGQLIGMLEVGAGFHPELTGKENIWLNAAILGMKKRDIRSKFDAIIDFAEIEKFLDTPLKKYSDGMQLRLAFAISINLNPDILLLDEVLAVGDSAFQQKCLAQINRLVNDGKTVLFTSHNMELLKTFCTSGIVLKDGIISFQGSIDDAVHNYQSFIQPISASF